MDVFSDLAINLMSTAGSFIGNFEVAFLTRVPAVVPSNAPARYQDLLNNIGFQEMPGHIPVQSSQTTSGAAPNVVTDVLLGGAIQLPANMPPTYIAACVFIFNGTLSGIVKPWLLITDATFKQVVNPSSLLDTVAQSPRILWSWTVQGTTPYITSQGLLRSPGTVPWEAPRTQHVYLYPQRINYVPNPSFEDVGLFGWRCKGTLTRQIGGVDNDYNAYGHVVGRRLEALPFPVSSKYATVSAYVRSSGASWVRLGLATWDTSWNTWPDALSAQLPVVDTWTRHSFVVRVPGNIGGVGLLVTSDGDFDIDLTMLEHEAELKDYFDGDSQTGILGDFSWQNVTHQSYSLWYNNKWLVGARLFGTFITGAVAQQGLVFDWVPAGTALHTHWDVLNQNDTKAALVDFPSPVIPPAITAARMTTWNVRGRVVASRATTWLVRRSIVASRATTWNVLAAVLILNDPLETLTNWVGTATIVAGRNNNGMQVTTTNVVTYTIPAGRSLSQTVSLSFRTNSIATGNSLFSFRTGATDHVTIGINGSGGLTALNGGTGGTSVGSSVNGLVVINTWYTLTVSVVIGSGTFGSVQIKLNSATVLSVSAADTSGGSTANIDTIALRGGGAASTNIFDDFILTTP